MNTVEGRDNARPDFTLLSRFIPVRDLLLRAKHLFVAANVGPTFLTVSAG
jgi:hypothetical protein